MPPLTIVRFAKNHDKYNASETAGFLPYRAAELIKGRVAVYVKGPVPDGVSAKEQRFSPPPASGMPYGAGQEGEEKARRIRMMQQIQQLSVAQAVEAIKGFETVADLEIVQEGEVNHPDYAGGRKGVLDAIAARLKVLADAEREASA